MACALSIEVCKQHFKIKFIQIPDLLLDLKIVRAENNSRKGYMKYSNPMLLILYERFLLKPMEMEQYDILDLTYARRKKSFTTVP